MKRVVWGMLIMLCACGTALAMALPAVAQTKPHPQPSSSDNNRAQAYRNAASSAVWAMQQNKKCKQGCHDCWYGLFPGAVNMCLGMRDWNSGAYQSGLELLKLSAGWGNKSAQYTLGLIYFNGHHVAADRPLGIAWLMLANERGNNPTAALATRSAMHLASSQEQAEARALFRKMRETYGDEVAGARAWRRLSHRLRFVSWGLRVKKICVDGNGNTMQWHRGIGWNTHVVCLPPGPFANSVVKISGIYFKGMLGTVTVGPLKQVPAPASSTP